MHETELPPFQIPGAKSQDASPTSGPSSQKKWQISLFAGLIFLLVAAPFTYKTTQSAFEFVQSKTGILPCVALTDESGPTSTGLIVHSAVFVLAVRAFMR